MHDIVCCTGFIVYVSPVFTFKTLVVCLRKNLSVCWVGAVKVNVANFPSSIVQTYVGNISFYEPEASDVLESGRSDHMHCGFLFFCSLLPRSFAFKLVLSEVCILPQTETVILFLGTTLDCSGNDCSVTNRGLSFLVEIIKAGWKRLLRKRQLVLMQIFSGSTAARWEVLNAHNLESASSLLIKVWLHHAVNGQ